MLNIGRRGDTKEGIWNNSVKKKWKKIKYHRHKMGT